MVVPLHSGLFPVIWLSWFIVRNNLIVFIGTSAKNIVCNYISGLPEEFSLSEHTPQGAVKAALKRYLHPTAPLLNQNF